MKSLNRVLLAFRTWDEKKNELQPHLQTADERTLNRLQLNHLQQAAHRLRGNLRPDEQPFMALLNNKMNRLEKQLYPNVLQRLFMRLKDQLIDGPQYLQQQAAQRTANLEQLKQQLKDKGLGSVAGKLEDHLNPDHKQVCLPLNCQLDQNRRLNYDLHFEKDVYGNFQLHRLDGMLLENGQVKKAHGFELEQWPGLKSNKIWSLLEGRALKQHYVDATGHQNSRWVELGPNGAQYYKPGSFDVSEKLNAMPEITRNREELIKYLENGQNIPTHWKQEGQYQNISVQADPANQTIKLFDAKGKSISAEQLGNKAKVLAKAQKPEAPVQQLKLGRKHGQRVA